MRLLVLENELTSARGGQELSLADVCEGLAARGHAVTVAFVSSGDLEARYRRICERLVPVRTYVIDRTRTMASIGEFVASLWAVRHSAPDVVYANQYLDSLFAAVTRRVAHVPFVCHLRLPPPEIIAGQYRIGLSQATRLIAISEQTRREWVARGCPADSIDVVHNGIDLDRFTPGNRVAARATLGLGAADTVVTYAGRLHPAKGVDVLLDAFAALVAHRPARLLVAGTPAEMVGEDGRRREYLMELEARATARGIGAAVSWLGHVPDMVALLRASDVTVLPSVWSEPFGRVIIESMACGTPVVASRTGGTAEILTGEFERWLVTPGDPAALAAALDRAIDERATDPDVAMRARRHVIDGFSAGRMVEGVERSLRVAMDAFGSVHAKAG